MEKSVVNSAINNYNANLASNRKKRRRSRPTSSSSNSSSSKKLKLNPNSVVTNASSTTSSSNSNRSVIKAAVALRPSPGHGHGHHHEKKEDEKLTYLCNKLLFYSRNIITSSSASGISGNSNSSSSPSTTEEFLFKYSKYLNELRTHCQSSTTSRRRRQDLSSPCPSTTSSSSSRSNSSSSPKSRSVEEEESLPIEIKLRTRGVFECIVGVLKAIITVTAPKAKVATKATTASTMTSGPADSEEKIKKKTVESILSNSLSLLGNSFAIDYAAREQVLLTNSTSTSPSPLLTTLNHLLQNKSFPILIHSKIIKCIGNLAIDLKAHLQIFNCAGLVINILNVIGILCKQLKNNMSNIVTPSSSAFAGYGGSSSSTSRSPPQRNPQQQQRHDSQEESTEKILLTSIRTIRILSTNPDSRILLWRLNTIVIVGDILQWFNTISIGLLLEIMKALNYLSRKFRIAPAENILKLTAQNDTILNNLINVFKTTTDKKILHQTIQCLTNLVEYKEIAVQFNQCNIYEILFGKVEKLMDGNGRRRKIDWDMIGLLLKLLKSIVSDDAGGICNYLIPYSEKIYVTLNVLRCTELESHHQFILLLYQNLLIGKSLEILIENGLLELLLQLFVQVYSINCSTFDELEKNIVNLDQDDSGNGNGGMVNCPVHKVQSDDHGHGLGFGFGGSGTGNCCEFIPKYRCMSPTYLQVQEQVKEYLQQKTFEDNIESNKTRPITLASCSPAHSWSSSSSSGFSENSSTWSNNAGSSAVFGSPSSPSPISPQSMHYSQSASESEPEEDQEDEGFIPISTAEAKLAVAEEERDHQPEPEPIEFQPTTTTLDDRVDLSHYDDYEIYNNQLNNDIQPNLKTQESNTRTMTFIIDILKTIAYLKPSSSLELQPQPYKRRLLQFLPILLNILVDGKQKCKTYYQPKQPTTSIVLLNQTIMKLNEQVFNGCQRILMKLFEDCDNFSYLLEHNVVLLLYKLIRNGNESSRETTVSASAAGATAAMTSSSTVISSTAEKRLEKYNSVLQNLLNILTGDCNNTNGFRKGYLLQNMKKQSVDKFGKTSTSTTSSKTTLATIGEEEDEQEGGIGVIMKNKAIKNASTASSLKSNVIISIPLLYSIDSFEFRQYELKYGAWTTLVDMLTTGHGNGRQQEQQQQFNGCVIISISKLCKTLGLKWEVSHEEEKVLADDAEEEVERGRGLSAAPATGKEEQQTCTTENTIKIKLDDGNEILASKQLLTQSSPVFTAMFDGQFLEASRSEVKLPFTCKETVELLLNELKIEQKHKQQQQRKMVKQNFTTATTKEARGGLEEATEASTPSSSSEINPRPTTTTTPTLTSLFQLLTIANQYMLPEAIQQKTYNKILYKICPYSIPTIYLQTYKHLTPYSTRLRSLLFKYLLSTDEISSELLCQSFVKLFQVGNKLNMKKTGDGEEGEHSDEFGLLGELKGFVKEVIREALQKAPAKWKGSIKQA